MISPTFLLGGENRLHIFAPKGKIEDWWSARSDCKIHKKSKRMVRKYNRIIKLFTTNQYAAE